MISVVTPSYNQVDFIEETLESVRCQTYEDIEHIVVDGESNDGTVELLESYDEAIRWKSEPDNGQSDAINKGFDMATGDVVAWLNSDDVFFDTRTAERVVEYFRRYDADVIYGDIALIDAESEVLKVRCVPNFDYNRLLRGCFIEQPALFFRSNVLEDERLDTSLEYVMDYEFWLRLAQDYDFRHVEDVLAGDRNHPNRKILKARDKMKTEGKKMRRTYGAEFGFPYRLGRASDIMFSGVPRRLKAVNRTVELHRDAPELAFGGQLKPLSTMARNVFRQNRSLL
ncbi:glycosyltransferase family 2 protein [Halorussus amylolyticus]|uniref:glycosyltransferase family 2 protein n=1 Tax=Halorussus amylolyticus TaxID=1126242 RepID=UPI001045A484|nr:glycosyltransferase family 2 protein [Halorussus amylolyticus]